MITRLRSLYGKLASPLSHRRIPHNELGRLLFGQQHILTQDFFLARFGKYHTIELQDLPHYKFLCEDLDSPFSDNLYSQYLACSWDYYYGKERNTQERRKQQIESYLKLYKEIRSRKHLRQDAIRSPIKVCQRPDGRILIVDGSHRAAIALRLGLDVPATFISPLNHLSKVVRVPWEFYGTARLNRPYRSVFHGGRELIKGRRRDTYERMQEIEPADLEGQTVLDLGCNIGASCFIATEFGASRAVGVEVSPKIATAAVRLNAYFAMPCYFVVHDLSKCLSGIDRFDTVLCFSLAKHLNSTEGIVATIKRAAGKVLYFEGHAGTKQAEYEYLLNARNFSRIELIGYGRDGIHTEKRTRPLFRCEVR